MDTTFSGSETLMDAPTLGVSYTVDLDDLFWSPTPEAMAGTSPGNSSSLKTGTISDETVYFSGGAALTSIDPYVGVGLQVPTVYFSGGSAGLQNTWSAKDGSEDSTAAGGLQGGTGGTNTPELSDEELQGGTEETNIPEPPDEERPFTNRYRWPYGTEEEDEFQEAPHTFSGSRETSEKALQIVWDALGSSGALSRRPELRSEFYELRHAANRWVSFRESGRDVKRPRPYANDEFVLSPDGSAAREPRFSQSLAEDPSTRRLWYAVATAHDLEMHVGGWTNLSGSPVPWWPREDLADLELRELGNRPLVGKERRIPEMLLYDMIFSSHLGHLAIVFLWAAGNLFHVAWQGNFEEWILNPLKVAPVAHAIWDPHFGDSAIEAYTPEGLAYPVNVACSGVYHWWYTIGMRTDYDLYAGALGLMAASCVALIGAWFHLERVDRSEDTPYGQYFGAGAFLDTSPWEVSGLASVAWAGHLVHVAIPESRGQHVRWKDLVSFAPHPEGLSPLWSLDWGAYSKDPDTAQHIFGTADGSGTAILTFLAGFHPQTQALWLTDIAHHHLALGVLLCLVAYPISLFRQITKFSVLPSYPQCQERSLHSSRNTLQGSLHLELAVSLAALGVVTSLVAQHMYSLPSYAFIAGSLSTQAALYVHHQYIAGFLMVGAFAHGAIFLVRDYEPYDSANSRRKGVLEPRFNFVGDGSVFEALLLHKEAIISHLSWVSLFLGFHTLGIYVHNDVVVAFGNPQLQILLEPVFAEYIQACSGKASYGFEVFLSSPTGPGGIESAGVWLPGWIDAINDSGSSLFLTVGPGDFLVHHAISLGIHTTVLILVKGALDARGSKLMPDKVDFGYSFPCDGPGRGGTCDISAWDAFYLAMFWMLNTISWTDFYYHWKHLCVWADDPVKGSLEFDTGSTYLMGWLGCYLSASSGVVINGYNPFGLGGGVDGSTWCWTFLFGHLVWATGFMFLISWRGYWQELIETLVWAHERTPIANVFQWRDYPVALSIVQGRLVGLVHFAAGFVLVYASFLLAGLPV
jgi:photosystem I P700 chlorophyll a apoprotein A2